MPTDLPTFLSQMTLEEKVAQLTGVQARNLVDNQSRFDPAKAAPLLQHGIGHISALSGTLPVTPAQAAELANTVQAYLREHTRLGIPAIMHEECLAGFCANGATIFPHAIGLASAWQPDLIQAMTTAIRAEMRAVGAHQALAPVLDVIRDPRWGRCEETLGEDAYLVAATGAAYIRGLQGENLNQGIASTAKHFAAHALSEGGRNCAPVHLGPRELRDTIFFPFEAAVKEANIQSFMNAYNDIDGEPCAASRELLTDILRGEWGFEGPVVSDYFAVERLISQHHTAGSNKEAACQALEAGLDIELPFADCFPTLVEAIREGQVSEATMDQAVERVLRFKQSLGLFESTIVSIEQAAAPSALPEHRALSRTIAQKSLILLKNEGAPVRSSGVPVQSSGMSERPARLLPLRKDLKSIAVIGPNAASPRAMLGDYSYVVTYTAARQIQPADTSADLEALCGRSITSILEGIRQTVSAETEIRYAQGCDSVDTSTDSIAKAVEAARNAEVAVVVVGDQAGMFTNGTSGENIDRVEASLYGAQAELVRQVCATGTPVVVVLANGRPPVIPDIAQYATAVLEAWHPGEAGGQAVADVLFGDVNPGGKLPVTLLSATGQAPLNYSLKPVSLKEYLDAPIRPVYAFGHGLSYTQFEYRDLAITSEALDAPGEVVIRCQIQNTGSVAGEEVAQLYIHDVVASLTRPVLELKGFHRLALEPGQVKTLTFRLHTDQLAFHNRQLCRVVEPGQFEVLVGSASDDIRLRGTFEVTGPTCEVPRMSRFFSITEE
jgi:beta-glucosidase